MAPSPSASRWPNNSWIKRCDERITSPRRPRKQSLKSSSPPAWVLNDLNAQECNVSDVSSKVSLLTRAYWRTTCRRCVKNVKMEDWRHCHGSLTRVNTKQVSSPALVWKQCGTEPMWKRTFIPNALTISIAWASLRQASKPTQAAARGTIHNKHMHATTNKRCTSNLQIKMH